MNSGQTEVLQLNKMSVYIANQQFILLFIDSGLRTMARTLVKHCHFYCDKQSHHYRWKRRQHAHAHFTLHTFELEPINCQTIKRCTTCIVTKSTVYAATMM